eukprot:gene7410-8230_t
MPLSKQRLSHFVKTEPTDGLVSMNNATAGAYLMGKRKYDEPSSFYKATTTATRRPPKRARHLADESSDGEASPRNYRNSSVKEKDRAKAFNTAFDKLRQSIPSLPKNKKLSKIEVLRLAICYMAYLQYVLDE